MAEEIGRPQLGPRHPRRARSQRRKSRGPRAVVGWSTGAPPWIPKPYGHVGRPCAVQPEVGGADVDHADDRRERRQGSVGPRRASPGRCGRRVDAGAPISIGFAGSIQDHAPAGRAAERQRDRRPKTFRLHLTAIISRTAATRSVWRTRPLRVVRPSTRRAASADCAVNPRAAARHDRCDWPPRNPSVHSGRKRRSP